MKQFAWLLALLIVIPSCKGTKSSHQEESVPEMTSIEERKIVLCGDGTHAFLDLAEDGYRWVRLEGKITKREGPSFRGINSYAMSHNGQYLALVKSDSVIHLHWTDQIKLMDVQVRGRIVHAIPGNRGKRLVILSKDKQETYLTLWDVDAGAVLVTQEETIPAGTIFMNANGDHSLLSLHIVQSTEGASTVVTYSREEGKSPWKSLLRSDGYSVPVFAQGRAWISQDGRVTGYYPDGETISFAGGEASSLQVGPKGNHVLLYHRTASDIPLKSPLDGFFSFTVSQINPIQEGQERKLLVKKYSNKVFFLDQQQEVYSASLSPDNELIFEKIQ